ncbi:PABS domain-containing protein [Kibdelosporangium persicum]
MLRRFRILGGISAAAMLACAVPALADDGYGFTDCSQYPHPGCELIAGSGGYNGSGAGSGNHQAGSSSPGSDDPWLGFDCVNIPLDDVDSALAHPEGPGGWYYILCSADGKDPRSRGPVWIPAGAEGPSISPAQVAAMARARLRLPSPVVATNPSAEQLVNLPTWLWLSRGWQEVSATASVAGVSVTAVARPTSVTWSMGEGGSVTCGGPGSPFPAGSDPTRSSPDCGYTYRRSSAGQRADAYPVTATVTWTVTWSGAGQGGTFPNITTSASVAFRVAESQGIATG